MPRTYDRSAIPREEAPVWSKSPVDPETPVMAAGKVCSGWWIDYRTQKAVESYSASSLTAVWTGGGGTCKGDTGDGVRLSDRAVHLAARSEASAVHLRNGPF